MGPIDLEKCIISSLKEKGFDARMVSASHITELQEEIRGMHQKVGFDEGFYAYFNGLVSFDAPEDILNNGSIIIFSMPQPILEVSFELATGVIVAEVPPTYNYHEDEDAISVITGLAASQGYKVERANLPKKLLAAHCGLAVYGRNNITYVGGSGSFHRLVALFSDLPCMEDSWGGLSLAEECKDCDICVKACPTKAIDPERFLLHAELCLTYFNENEDDIPDWIDPLWHNALVGCLRCQVPCPMNREYIRNKDYVSFSLSETEKILDFGQDAELDPETIKKLDYIGFKEDVRLISRNLGLLLKRRAQQ